MPRNLTDPNYDDTFEWQERVTDADGDSLSISVTIDGTDISNVAWADFTTTTNTINGSETEVLVDFTADRSGMTGGKTYQFEVIADDGIATANRTFTLSIKESFPVDGTKYFVTDATNDTIAEYTLSTAYQASSASKDNEKTPTTDGTSFLSDVFIRPDGSELFVFQFDGFVNKYTLGTNWTFNSITKVGSADISSDADQIRGGRFSPDGTKLFVNNTGILKEFSLGTPWDMSTVSFVNSVDVQGGSREEAMHIDRSGEYFFIHADDLIKYKFGTPFDSTTLTQEQKVNFLNDVRGVTTAKKGSKLYLVENNSNELYEYDLDPTFDLTSSTQVSKVNFGSLDNPYGSLIGK